MVDAKKVVNDGTAVGQNEPRVEVQKALKGNVADSPEKVVKNLL